MARILVVSDNCNLPTGMGRVGREIALGLQKRGHEVSYLAWFSPPWLDNKVPIRLYKTNNNYYGSDVIDSVVTQERPDIVLTIGDIWMVDHIADPNRCHTRSMFQWIGYIPIDGVALDGGVPPSWKFALDDMDLIVPYTQYGRKAIAQSLPHRASQLSPIPHGVDTSVYYPVSDQERLEIRRNLGIRDETVVFLSGCRKQFRKNVPELCKIWKIFRKDGQHPKSVFWPHMAFKDQMGWDLYDIFEIYGMDSDLMYFKKVANCPNNVDLLPESELARLYNAADVHVLMSGEGWGLPNVEAMACGKPCILLDHSANSELVGNNERGLLVNVSGTMTGGHSTERPYPDLEHAAKQMSVLYNDAKLRKELGERAAEFAKTLTWDFAVSQWNHTIERLSNPLAFELTLETV